MEDAGGAVGLECRQTLRSLKQSPAVLERVSLRSLGPCSGPSRTQSPSNVGEASPAARVAVIVAREPGLTQASEHVASTRDIHAGDVLSGASLRTHVDDGQVDDLSANLHHQQVAVVRSGHERHQRNRATSS
jgi:hypothetical protein